ncbi:acyl-CoA dehydrogenase [Actinomadura xylanilytica]|uniref:acyl-CoA dehydrogenase n=1 Tax=Actinomadura xylanilytica TaxID=887459 RepID=UPI00255AB34E|nr:acyl-CoA dehydrogenase [Actinomadura xylanilytica]MDL4774211.1 acyl-CoA dehydrogenase [Actinomadura xylanilytica]
MIATELERRFGDPWDSGNPTGHAAVLAADERGETFAAGEQVLDAVGLNAEFVPVDLGGRLARLDHLIQVMRPVFRRDPALGLGYGVSSLIAAVNVWAAGDASQRRRVADLLLAGGRVAAGYHELAHGNDFAGNDLSALPGPDGVLRLNGRKEVIANAGRAEAMVLFARTSSEPGSRSHSQLLAERADLPAGAFRDLPRFPTSGMRGVQLGGLEFRDCPVPADTVLGVPGHGVETALRSFQITRTVLPAMATGILEAGLDVTARFVDARMLYGRSLADMPHIRSILADAFVDLLICECLATVTARSVHLLPDETSLYASASKYFIATLLTDAVYELSRVLGAQFYLRDGEYGIFQKHLRDLPPASFGHSARATCLGTVLPQLPRLARKAWRGGDAPPSEVYRPGGPLPPLSFDRLTLSSGGRDSHSAALTAALDAPDVPADLRRHLLVAANELGTLGLECAALAPRDLTVDARPEVLELPARYAAVLAATACVNVWLHSRDRSEDFLADPQWVTAALRRIAGRLGRDPGPRPRHHDEALAADVLARHRRGGGFGLFGL